MKKLLLIAVLFLSLKTYAQNDVTTFLGIPVDGTKAEMIAKLKAKGFTSSSYDKDILEGEFNGQDVNLYIGTNNNKVYRIMVCDKTSINEADIKIRFNILCRQFDNNQKYTKFPSDADYEISDDEDISYNMIVKSKRYQASYYQRPESIYSFIEKYAESGWIDLSEEQRFEKIASDPEMFSAVINISKETLNKHVWFMISEFHGKYYITMYYDNEYNQAQGEDL